MPQEMEGIISGDIEIYLVAMQREVQLAALVMRHAGERWTRQRVAIRTQLVLQAVKRTSRQIHFHAFAPQAFPFSDHLGRTVRLLSQIDERVP